MQDESVPELEDYIYDPLAMTESEIAYCARSWKFQKTCLELVHYIQSCEQDATHAGEVPAQRARIVSTLDYLRELSSKMADSAYRAADRLMMREDA